VSTIVLVLDLRPHRDSGVPLTTQLVWRIRALIDRGELAPGARLPSVRAAAAAAGVNVNTVRAAYAKLEAAGVVRTEQGRGTFVAPPQAGRAATSRRRLQEQIARLEAELVTLPPVAPDPRAAAERRPRARVLSLEELTAVRDMLDERVRALRATRAQVASWLEARAAAGPADEASAATPTSTPRPPSARPWSPTLAGARIRWTGAG
jgi:DNA-binding transcriptional regulator YhcF (GntR family)